MTALYFYFATNERLTRKQVLGILLGFIGVSIIVILPLLSENLTAPALTGNLLILVAAVAFAAYGVLSKKNQGTFNASPMALVFYFCLITMLASVPFAINEMAKEGFLQVIAAKHVFAAILTGVVGTGVFYLLYQYALKVGSEVSASLFTYLQPIVTMFLAYLFLSEQLTLPFFIGGVLAVVGAQLASVSRT